MKNIEYWKPTKYIFSKNKVKANRNEKIVNLTSRLLADKIASFYHYAIPKFSKGELLDLGCGNAPLYLIYKDYSKNITCIDWGNSAHKKSYLDYEFDLNQSLKLENNIFDTIIFSDVLEHIKNPNQLIDEIYRILKPKGKLLMNVPFYYNLHEKPYDYYRYTEYALIDLFKNAGFKIIEINQLGGILEVLTDLISKTIKKIPLIGRFLTKVTLYIYKILSKIKKIQKFSKNSSKTFPYAYSLVIEKP